MSINVSPDSIIFKLIKGFKAFRVQYFEAQHPLYADLVRYGQRPNVLVIACSDSRVDPALLLKCSPGDLFVVRNVANLVPPFSENDHHFGTSSALQFAVCHLGVSDIIVLGHRHCGGIYALMDSNPSKENMEFINAWMASAEPAKVKVLSEHQHKSDDEKQHLCEKESLHVSLDNLKTFPWIEQRVASGQLAIHAWFFDLESGMIEAYDDASAQFQCLSDVEAWGS